MKLQKEIVLGIGRKLALAVCLAALAGAAHATFYYSGAGTANSATLSTAVKWYTDASLKVVADPQPTPTENDDNTYVFLESKKMQDNYTFPVGTHVWLGTSSKRWSPNCQSMLWTIPDCTIYGLSYLVNYANTGGFAGNYQFVKTAQGIVFGGTNLKDNTLYGVYLSGTFTGESDVLLSTAIGGYSGTGLGGSARVGFNGDFSGYKGKFDSKAWTGKAITDGGLILHFISASSMGDPTVPFTDAVTLRHYAMLRIDETVTQTSARGITLDLADGQFASLYAPAASDSWTLRAPLSGGATGTLKKVGAGTVTLAGSMEAKNILVEAGTLVVSNGASFVVGTTITVASGAKLVNKTLADIPNAAVVVEDGGSYVCDSLMAIPFDGANVDTLDGTALTAATCAALTRPISVRLSQTIPLPFAETNRWALAAFDAAVGFTADDFMDVTPKTFSRLPTTWLETETADGTTTLFLVARPALRYLKKNSSNSLYSAENWTDEKTPHEGADYYQDTTGPSSTRTGGGSAIPSFDFDGETLTLARGVGVYAQNFSVKELRLLGDCPVNVVHASDSSGVFNPNYWPRIFRGIYSIEDSCTDAKPATLSIDVRTQYADLRQTLIGTGSLTISTIVRAEADGGQGLFPVYFSGMNGDFGGRLCVTTAHSKAVMDMYVTNGLAFGGPLPTFSANAVRLLPMSTSKDGAISITATADMTVDAANRGWYMTSGTLGASNGVTFVFAPPRLSVKTKLCKTGGGTLALGCNTVGGGRTFAVKEGYVKALSADCCTNLNLTVSAGAGIKADLAPADATVAAKGLIAKSIQPADAGGTILVAPDLPQDFAMPPQFTVVACTVPAEQADLTDTLRPTYVSKYAGRIEKDAAIHAAEGLVTYTATWTKTGLTLIFR